MYYVISDLHGEYDKYRKMLNMIGFSQEDTLFVLGDVIDRGAEPVKLLQELSMQSNVYPLLGNHEWMALQVLESLLVEVTAENYDNQITPELLEKLAHWQANGGDVTLRQFTALPKQRRLELLAYLEEFEPYQTVDTPDGRSFLLVHGGLRGYHPDRPLADYSPEELVWERPVPGRVYYDPSFTVVVGHTPTRNLIGKDVIFRDGNVMYIDCGAAFGGRLSCLCLDTMEEFYV